MKFAVPSLRFERLDHASPAMAETIRSLMFDAYQVEAALIGRADDFLPLGRMAADIASADATFIGVFLERDGPGDEAGQGSIVKPVAVAELERPPVEGADSTAGRTLNIASFVVHPSRFRRGIGSALLRHILDAHAPLRDGDGSPHRITVSTAVANQPAIVLYEKHDFAISRHWTTPDGIEMVTMSSNCGRERLEHRP